MGLFTNPQKSEIKAQRYECKITLVTGFTRAGKTSSVTARQILDYKYNNKWRMKQAKLIVNNLQARGFTKLKLQDHVYYSNYRMELNNHGVQTHHVRFDELGLPNEDYQTMNLCPGAVVIIDEPDAQLNARSGMSSSKNKGVSSKPMNDYVQGFLKFHGHLEITLILITQDPFRLDKILRGLVHEVVYIYKKEDKYSLFGKLKSTTWTEWHYGGSRELIAMGFKGVPPVGDYRKYGYIEEKSFTFKGNIHNYYNSEAYANLFLTDANMEYEYRDHMGDEPTVDELEEYKSRYGYVLKRVAKQPSVEHKVSGADEPDIN